MSGEIPPFPPNMSAWYVSPNCGLQTNCTQIYGDAQYKIDATSNSTTTLTCPDCTFTQADVGKVAWATTQGSGAGVGFLIYTTSVCPQTTIASVTNATTVVLANACTANGSGNVVFVWGHDDGATLAAANWGCNVVHFSTAGTFIMTGQPFFNTNTCDSTGLRVSAGAPGASWVGDGFGASQAVFVMTPNFAWNSCATVTGNSSRLWCMFRRGGKINRQYPDLGNRTYFSSELKLRQRKQPHRPLCLPTEQRHLWRGCGRSLPRSG